MACGEGGDWEMEPSRLAERDWKMQPKAKIEFPELVTEGESEETRHARRKLTVSRVRSDGGLYHKTGESRLS
jgi:hypothetical protein